MTIVNYDTPSRGLGYYRFILFPLGLKPIGAVMGYANLVRI